MSCAWAHKVQSVPKATIFLVLAGPTQFWILHLPRPFKPSLMELWKEDSRKTKDQGTRGPSLSSARTCRWGPMHMYKSHRVLVASFQRLGLPQQLVLWSPFTTCIRSYKLKVFTSFGLTWLTTGTADIAVPKPASSMGWQGPILWSL